MRSCEQRRHAGGGRHCGNSRASAGGNIINGLFVDTARELIDKAIPAPSDAQRDEAFAKAQEILLGFGVTGVGSMSTSSTTGTPFAALARLGG